MSDRKMASLIFLSHIFLSGGRNDDQGLRWRIAFFAHQLTAMSDNCIIIYSQQFNRCAATRRQTGYQGSIQPEMIAPVLRSRIEEERGLAVHRINGRKIRAFDGDVYSRHSDSSKQKSFRGYASGRALALRKTIRSRA